MVKKPHRFSSRKRRKTYRSGATLLDVAAGSMLLAVILIPSAHLIGQSQSCNARLANRQTMLFEAENRLEATKIALSSPAAFNTAWATPADTRTQITIADGPDLNSRTRIYADSTIPAPARLVTIEIDIWQDIDGDNNMDATEPTETIRTQWASP
jgi:hypothetical protein